MSGVKHISIDTRAAARRLAEQRRHEERIVRHRRAVAQARVRVERISERRDLADSLTPAEREELAALRQELYGLSVPDHEARACAAEAQAAEWLREAERIAEGAAWRAQALETCRQGVTSLAAWSALTGLASRRRALQQRFEELAGRVSAPPLDHDARTRLAGELKQLGEDHRAFVACARRLAELQSYADAIRGEPWAASLDLDGLVERVAALPISMVPASNAPWMTWSSRLCERSRPMNPESPTKTSSGVHYKGRSTRGAITFTA